MGSVETMIFNESEDEDSCPETTTAMYEVKLLSELNEIKHLGLVYDYINRKCPYELAKDYEISFCGKSFSIKIAEELKDSKKHRKFIKKLGKTWYLISM